MVYIFIAAELCAFLFTVLATRMITGDDNIYTCLLEPVKLNFSSIWQLTLKMINVA